MTTKEVIDKIKDGVIWVVVGALFTIIPFYYNTNSAVDKVEQETISNTSEINNLKTKFSNNREDIVVLQERNSQIEKRLERIEKKLDYLIEQDN